MKSYAFYFAVGLLAFVSSSFLVKTVYQLSKTQSIAEVNNQPKTENLLVKNEEVSSQSKVTKKSFKNIKFTCEDEKLTYFFTDFLQNKWLYENLERQQEIFNCAKELEVQEVDLNNDKQPEFIVEFMYLDAHGNGLQSIFESKNRKYKRISSFVYGMNFRIKKEKTNKYQNLVLFCNYSNGKGEFNNFRFNGKEYLAHSCSYAYPDYSLEKIKCRKFNE